MASSPLSKLHMTKQTVSLSSSFTAPCDGIIDLAIQSSGSGRYYCVTNLFIMDEYAYFTGANARTCYPIRNGESIWVSDISNASIYGVTFFGFEES